jgi:hypothetical protein
MVFWIGERRKESPVQGLKSAGIALACIVAATAIITVAALPGSVPARQGRHCQPVVKKIFRNEGFYVAKVLIVRGDVGCREARNVLWRALTAGGTYGPVGNGWECMSKGQFGALAEKCTRTGPSSIREVIKTTKPKPCSTCHANRH